MEHLGLPFLFDTSRLTKIHYDFFRTLDNNDYTTVRREMIGFFQTTMMLLIAEYPTIIIHPLFKDPYLQPLWKLVPVDWLYSTFVPKDMEFDNVWRRVSVDCMYSAFEPKKDVNLLERFQYLSDHWDSYRPYKLDPITDISTLKKLYALQVHLIIEEQKTEVYKRLRQVIIDLLKDIFNLVSESGFKDEFLIDSYLKDVIDMTKSDPKTSELETDLEVLASIGILAPSKFDRKSLELQLWSKYFCFLLEHQADVVDLSYINDCLTELPVILKRSQTPEAELIFNLYSSDPRIQGSLESKIYVFKRDLKYREFENLTLHLILGFPLQSLSEHKFLELAMSNIYLSEFHIPELLLLFGSDVNDQLTRHPFIKYITRFPRDQEKVKWLIAHGFDINSRDHKQATLLHLCDSSLARWLIANEADMNVVDYNCRSPLDYAIDDGDLQKVKLLLEAGAKKCLVIHVSNYNIRKNRRKKIDAILKTFGIVVTFVRPEDDHY